MTTLTENPAMDPPQTPRSEGRIQYRSLEQLANSTEFEEMLHREFPEGITDAPDEVSRRNFLSVIAASVALAGFTGCRKPEQNILPFGERPEGMVPGLPTYYATVHDNGGYAVGTLVRSSDGRPTKVEGNKLHPSSGGAATQFMQAEILSLYDPARARQVRADPKVSRADDHEHGWDLFASWWHGDQNARINQIVASGGKGLHLLMPPTTSPSLNDLAQQIRDNLPQARVHTWQPLHRDNELAGSELAFGRALDINCELDRAGVVVALDADFLGLDGDVLKNSRSWGRSRKINKKGDTMSRLYVVEAGYSLTGTMADHRFRVRASEVAEVVFALAAQLGIGAGAFDAHKSHGFRTRSGIDWIEVVAQDLLANRGKSALLVGPRQPAVVHGVGHMINEFLGNSGATLTYTETDPAMAGSRVAAITALAEAMDKGEVSTLVCLGTNPVYDAPADLDFASKLAKVAERIQLGLYEDETTRAMFADDSKTNWFLHAAHPLEAWGDLRAVDGTLSIQQPLIAPLHGGRTASEVLALVIDHPAKDGYGIVRGYWETHGGVSDFETWWSRALHDGLVRDSSAPTVPAPLVRHAAVSAAVGALQKTVPGSAANMEVVFRADSAVLDGRYANNSWLQELPDPLTKLTWDNAALISRATAQALGVDNGDLLTIEAGGRTLEVAAWILPGHADWSLTITLGYGRALPEECKVAHGTGFNAYSLRSSTSQGFLTRAVVSGTGRSYQLVSSQDHGTMVGRNLVREDNIDHYNNAPDPHGDVEWFAPMADSASQVERHKNENKPASKIVNDLKGNRSLWQERVYDENLAPLQWGMTIDLNSCTGCNACVVACVSENNIPVVGKSQVAKGREMHWIRMDRYFSEVDMHEGKLEVADDPQVLHQPLPCMQCENAPCESVCPVAATSHSPEGLNDMVYNRCIGTRYCSNNCPYKVRRFNWLDFHGLQEPTDKMLFNPDVTVRSRGVMEKCTYCVQRINGVKTQAKLEKRDLQDDELQHLPACAQTCPTEAITFGNLLDTHGQVAKNQALPTSYGLLNDLNTRPRTTYLARFRNPNKNLS